MGDTQQGSSLKVYRTKVVVTDEHFFPIPVDDLVDALADRLSTENADKEMLKDFVSMVEGLHRHQFNQLQRGLLNDFRPFAVGATETRLLVTEKEGQRIHQQLNEKEKGFLDTLYKLLTSAHFELLTEAEWAAATKEEFQCTLPMTVNLKCMDPSLPATFYATRPELKAIAPVEVSDHILVFHRGVQQERVVHTDIQKRVQMFVEYVIIFPLMGALLWLLAKLNELLKSRWVGNAVKKLQDALPDNYVAVEAAELAIQNTLQEEHANRVKEGVRFDAARGLRGKLFKVLERKSLRRTFPTAWTCLKGLLSKTELREPAFQDVIVVYRNVMPPLTDEQKSQLTPLEQDLRKRNICIKRLFNIPMADLEIIFPDRKLHLQPITIVQLVVNMVAGMIAAYMMVAKTEITMSLLISVLGLVGGRIAQVYGQAQTELVNTERTLNKQVYERNVASQEAVLFQTLNDMLEQYLKEAVLLFFTLLANKGTPMTQEQVQQSTEKLLKERFNVEMSLDVDNVLPQLLEWGIVKKDPSTGMLTCMTLAEGLAQLDDKWDSCFSYEGGAAKRKQGRAAVAQVSSESPVAAQGADSDSKLFSINGLLRKRRSQQ